MLAAMRAVAAINQDKAKEYSKMKYDLKAKTRDFSIGTKVLVFAPAITGTRAEKLRDRWQGPYEILGKVTPVTYLVDMPELKKKHCTVHVEAVRQWREPSLPIHALTGLSE